MRPPQAMLLVHGGDGAPLLCDVLTAGGAVRERLALQAVADVVRGKRTIVLIRGFDVLLTRCRVPSRNRRRVAAALPFALEDRVSDDVNRLHFAVGNRAVDGSYAVAVIDGERLRSLCTQLHNTGVSPWAVIPEVLAVPRQWDHWSVLVLGDRALVRTGEEAGFGAEVANIEPMLKLALAQKEDRPPRGITLYSEGDQAALADKLCAQLRIPCTEVRHPSGDAQQWLLAGHDSKVSINLLQGRFAGDSGKRDAAAVLVPTVALTALWLLLCVGVRYLDYRTLRQESETLNRQIAETFAHTFPEVRKIVNPKAQMQQQLEALHQRDIGGRGPLDMLAGAAPFLSQRPDFEILSLEYGQGELNIEVSVGALNVLDQVVRQLNGTGRLSAKIQNAVAHDQHVQGRLRITSTRS